MINHLRTLLLGRSAEAMAGSLLGGEFIPADFIPGRVPRAVELVRQAIFGVNPDTEMLNLRMLELLNVIHGTPFTDRIFTYDTRITYQPFATRSIFDAPWGAAVSTDANASLFISGDNEHTTTTAKVVDSWTIGVNSNDSSSAELTVTRTRPDTLGTVVDVTFTDGLSEPFALPGSLLTAKIEARGSAGTIWTVQRLRRPAQTLADVIARVKTAGVEVNAGLFEGSDEESTAFRGLWNSRTFGWRVAGLAFAVQKSVEESRN